MRAWVTDSTPDAYCLYTAPGSCNAQTTITVAKSGGVGPYTYLWSKVSGVGSISAGGSTATCTVGLTGDSSSNGVGVFRCLVTDTSDAQDTYSDNASVQFTHESDL